MDDNFYNQRNEKVIEKIRKICEEMPVYVNEFLLSIQMRTSPLTRLGYVNDLKIFFNYLIKSKYKNKTDISQISTSDIAALIPYDIELYIDYLASYKLNGRSYKSGEQNKERKICSLRTFFRFLYRKDYIKENITQKVDMPKKHEKPIIFLETNEIANLLDTADNGYLLSPKQKSFQKKTRLRDVAMLTLFLGTGIRISECVGLDKDDIDFENNAISIIRKGGNKSILYFSEEVKKALNEYLEFLNKEILEETDFGLKIKDEKAFFMSLQGKRISIKAVENLVKKYAKIVSPLKKITPHKLRSTFGTQLYRNTNDIYVVADVLGHKDINTTKKHYAALSDDIRRQAANIIKLRDDDK